MLFHEKLQFVSKSDQTERPHEKNTGLVTRKNTRAHKFRIMTVHFQFSTLCRTSTEMLEEMLRDISQAMNVKQQGLKESVSQQQKK